MDPKFQNEIVNNPSTQESTPQVDQPVTSPSGKKSKPLIIIGLILVMLLIAAPLYFLTRSKPVQKDVSVDQEVGKLIAQVKERKIYEANVRAVAREYLEENAINAETIRQYIPVTVERAVLDQEAYDQKITINGNEIADVLKSRDVTISQYELKNDGYKKQLYYDILKTKMVSSNLNNVTINSLSYWVPAFGDVYPQKPEYAEMRRLWPQVMASATRDIRSGKSSYEIGKSIIGTYPVFKDQLAVNSYRYITTTDISRMQKPVQYEYSVNNSNKRFMDFIFSLKKDEIKELVLPDGEGAFLVQVVDRVEGSKVAYDAWLKQKISEYVTYSE